VEQAVAQELGADVRVDTHIEPLEQTAYGKDVTADRPDLVAEVQRFATAEPEVLDCHEVIVTSFASGLAIVAHVRGRKTLPLDRMHDASVRIEKEIHKALPEIASVIIHFEPA
jgi:divalent metal cation (Fe/Co/Zn/Cd) transporter